MSSPACVLKYINSGLETGSSIADSTEVCCADSADVCCVWDDDNNIGEELLNWLFPASELGVVTKRPAEMHTHRDQESSASALSTYRCYDDITNYLVELPKNALLHL